MAGKSEDSGMWINPKSNVRGTSRRARQIEDGINPHLRYLELADIALSPGRAAGRKTIVKGANKTRTKP
jgi:hypothetical protein